MNLSNTRKLLQQFDFTRLFVEEPGWKGVLGRETP